LQRPDQEEVAGATAQGQEREAQRAFETVHHAPKREQPVQHRHDPPDDWWGPEPPLVSGQIPPGCRGPAPADQDLGEEEQAVGAGTSCAAVGAAAVVAAAVAAAAVAEGQERRQGAAGPGSLTGVR
jgi:hypothetical protein